MIKRRLYIMAVVCLGAMIHFGCGAVPAGGDGSPIVIPLPVPGGDDQAPPIDNEPIPDGDDPPPDSNDPPPDDNNPPPDDNNPPPDGGPGEPTIGGADELAFIEAMTLGARTTASTGRKLIASAVFVVFQVSINNGGALTTTGTATFDAQGSLSAYSPVPANRLVVNTSTNEFELAITAFEGDINSVNSFILNHAALSFRITAAGIADLQIDSAVGNSGFRQHFVGTLKLPRSEIQTDIVRAGGDQFDLNAPIGSIERSEASSIVGTINAASGIIQASEVFRDKIVNTSQQIKIGVASSGDRNGAHYAFAGAFFRQIERDGFATEPDFWQALGGLERDGVSIGECKFDGAVVPGIASPLRTLRLADSTEIGM